MVDPVIASRLQFALTTIVHIIFPVMSMGLAPFLIYFTWKEIHTEQPIYEQLRRFWTKIFAMSFVIGTVTDPVLEFEFGTNFAAFSRTAGELFGGPLALEGMMACMLEATFLAIFVFGCDRVSDRLYFLSSIKTTTDRDFVNELIEISHTRKDLHLNTIPAPSTLCKAFDRLERPSGMSW